MFELMPYPGSRGLGRFRKEMDDLFGRFFETRDWMPTVSGDFVPAVNVKETDLAIEVTAEVPGLKAEEIDVSLSGDVLTIKGGEKKELVMRPLDAIGASHGLYQKHQKTLKNGGTSTAA